MKVKKNNFVQLALKDLDYPEVGDMAFGPTALTLVRRDVNEVARTLVDFAKSESLGVKGALVGGKIYSAEEVEGLSRLPGRDQLLSMLLSAMTGPVRNCMYAMNGVAQKLVRVLQAVADKKSSEG